MNYDEGVSCLPTNRIIGVEKKFDIYINKMLRKIKGTLFTFYRSYARKMAHRENALLSLRKESYFPLI